MDIIRCYPLPKSPALKTNCKTSLAKNRFTHTHTHTHAHIYIYILFFEMLHKPILGYNAIEYGNK